MTPPPGIILLLPVLRMFVWSAAEPQTYAWRSAYDKAAETFGEARGLALAHKLQALLWALMRGKPAPIEVKEVSTETTLTDDEVLILEMVVAMGRDDTAQARDALALLTCGRVHAEVVRLGLDLARALNAEPPQRAERPLLRVV